VSVRFVVKASASVVSVTTFVLLYFGLVDLARLAGMDDARAWLYPLAIDGMVAAGYAATLVLTRQALRFAWSVVGVGSMLSLAGQWLHAERLSDWQWAGPVAAAPALSMALVWHLLFLVLKVSGHAEAAETVAAESVAVVPNVSPVPVRSLIPAPVAVAVAAVAPKAVVSAPVRVSKPRPVNGPTLAKAVAVLSAGRASGERVTGSLMAERLGLANAGTPAGNRTGQRWVTRAEDALKG
jgi:hypothetical protein